MKNVKFRGEKTNSTARLIKTQIRWLKISRKTVGPSRQSGP